MRFVQNGFNAGQWSPLMEGRTDLEKYPRSLYRGENFVLDPRGPAMLRPGFRYIAGTKTNASASVLIDFQFSVDVAYVLEFGDQYMRVFKDQAQVDSGGSPYEIATPYAAADVGDIWAEAQSADVLYLFHPDYAPRKLSRTGDTSWTLATVAFNPPAITEGSIAPAGTLTLSASSGLGVTASSGLAGTFVTGDVGRTIVSGVGRASIVAFISDTQVTVDILDAFTSTIFAAGDWTIEGSPNGSLTPSDTGPVGSVITLTSSGEAESLTNLLSYGNDYWSASGSGTNEYYLVNTAPFYPASKPDRVYLDDVLLVEGAISTLGIDQWDWGNADGLGYNTIYIRLSSGADPDTLAASPSLEDRLQMASVVSPSDLFRSSDVGKYVRINNGVAKLTKYTSATSVEGEVIKALASSDASTIWTLEDEAWNATNGYPAVGVFFEDRLTVAGSNANPTTVWGSAVGDYENFAPGIDDADSFEFTIPSRKVQKIRWIEPREYLLIGTASGEWRLGPEDTGDPLTPFNVVAKEVRKHGSANILPVSVDGTTLFVQRAKRKIRELVYNFAEDGFRAPDMTLLAEDITVGNIAGMAYQQEPYNIVWVWLEDGSLRSFSYMREQDVIGWMEHPMGGASVESMAVIPGDGYDEVWAIVNRTVNGSTVRYVEMMEPVFRDSAATFAANKGLNARFLDSSLVYNGASTTTITGLDHLEGEPVDALVDGKAVLNVGTVASGQITLPVSATVVHVGLFNTATLQLMRLDTQTREGSIQGRRKKIDELTVRVVASGPFKVGPDEANLDVVYDRERALVLGAAHPLFTGDLEVGYDGGWESDARPMIVQDLPLPLIVVAVMVDADV